MIEAVQALVDAGEAIRPKEPEPVPEPVYSLSQVLKASQEVYRDMPDKDDALVALLAKLLGIPLFEQGALEAIRAQVHG